MNHGWLEAVEKKIQFHVRLDSVPEAAIPNSELSIILGNALDNALEPSRYLPEGQRAIWVEISYVKQGLLISVRNRYKGELELKGGRPKSRKRGKRARYRDLFYGESGRRIGRYADNQDRKWDF